MKSVVIAAAAAVGLFAQTPAPAPAQTPPAAAKPVAADTKTNEPAERKQPIYVRRISFGVTAGAAILQPTRNESLDQNFNTVPHLEITANNSGKSTLFEFGFVVQAAVTKRWAVAMNPMLRTGIKMESTKVQLIGVDNVNTVQDDRVGTNFDVTTTARFLDVPLLARRYSKDRTERGFRWFAELGPRSRTAIAVRTATHVTPPPNTIDPYDLTTRVSYKQTVLGGTGGFGLQFIDDFGIRFVPEVRYTHWFGSNFGDVTGRSKSQQVEVVFTLAF